MKLLLIMLLDMACISSCHRGMTQSIKCNCWSDTSFHSQGITYVRLADSGEKNSSQNELIDPRNERAIKDTFIDWGDGSEPGYYWQVEYDYGNPTPNYYQVMRWILGDSIPICFNEWQIERKDIFTNWLTETDDYLDHQIISFYCPNHRFLLQKYSEDIYISQNKIEVIDNKDTMDRYMKIKQYELNWYLGGIWRRMGADGTYTFGVDNSPWGSPRIWLPVKPATKHLKLKIPKP